MAKNIQYLGRVNLPFEKILSIIKSKSTKVNTTNDTEDTAHIMGRDKQQLAFSKMILKLYRPKKNIANFFRYTNKALSGMIPKSFKASLDVKKVNLDILLNNQIIYLNQKKIAITCM